MGGRSQGLWEGEPCVSGSFWESRSTLALVDYCQKNNNPARDPGQAGIQEHFEGKGGVVCVGNRATLAIKAGKQRPESSSRGAGHPQGVRSRGATGQAAVEATADVPRDLDKR